MGYVAAKGGFAAIRAAEELVRRRQREAPAAPLAVDQLVHRLGYAVDRVMGEGGLWDERLAARALRQAEGDVIEAAHLVRAHRATLPRLGYTRVVDADEIDVLRRIVPAFRQVPGPQLLGRTLDYTGRLLDPDPELDPDSDSELGLRTGTGPHLGSGTGPRTGTGPRNGPGAGTGVGPAGGPDPAPGSDPGDQPAGPDLNGHGDDGPRVPGRLLDVLRRLDLLVDRRRTDDPEPVDISREPVRPGSPRSARLSSMARAETGALVQLWYRNILGPDRHLHEVTLGEVRHGRLPVALDHPVTGEPVTIGQVRVTEVEAIEDLDGPDEDRTRFDAGYGLCLGHNERKAIAMANLDIAVHRAGAHHDAGTGTSGSSGNRGDDHGGGMLEQSVLLTTDGLDASGFLEHLKLPHYVTFRSMVERKQAVRTARAAADGPGAADGDEGTAG